MKIQIDRNAQTAGAVAMLVANNQVRCTRLYVYVYMYFDRYSDR